MNTKTNLGQKLPTLLATPLIAALTLCSAYATAGTTFSQLNLVTDDPSVNPAQITDASLKNAWGLSYSSTGPFWISDNGTGVSTLYRVNPGTMATTKVGLTVSIPGDGSVTGQVFNNSPAFNGNLFMFVSEDGTISQWKSGTSALALQAASTANVYKGVTEAVVDQQNYLYAANFRTDKIDVIKDATTPDLTGTFTDPNLPAGYAPFNIQNLGGNLYVTYAIQDATKHDEIAGAGNGMVDEFDAHGNFIARVTDPGGALNAPWGLAIAPSSFGVFAGDLLVGNFGDGKINAYDPVTHAFVGQLLGGNGQPLSIDGLWALSIGNDGGAGSSQALFFTAGPHDEANGLFGAITAVPAPSAIWLFGSALIGAGCLRKRQDS